MLLDLCLALSVPSIRELRQRLTPDELRLWIEKYKRDQFGSHGRDVRDAVRDANMLNTITALAGSKGRIKPDDLLICFADDERKQTGDGGAGDWRSMKATMMGMTQALGGEVIHG